MSERLGPIEAAVLASETATTPAHTGSVLLLDPPGGNFRLDELVSVVEAKITAVPRFRQRLRRVPANLARPVWVEDAQFDLGYHLRRAALPPPGSLDQLAELIARVQSRRLDERRPLWEVYVIEGLAGGAVALVTKAHPALLDGSEAADIADLIVSSHPEDIPASRSAWLTTSEPSQLSLAFEALVDHVRSPIRSTRELVRHGVDDIGRAGRAALGGVGDVVAALARAGADPAPSSPLSRDPGDARRFAMVDTDLDGLRRARDLIDGDAQDRATVHDAILATVTGALRTWMLTRGEAVRAGTVVRALVPVSVGAAARDQRGSRITACLVDLPVGEPSPAIRLHRLAFTMRSQVERGGVVGAAAMVASPGFAPPTIHAWGARLGRSVSGRLFNLTITNVPGPQTPVFVGSSRVVASYPVIPLVAGQTLAIGVTSYDGRVYFGLNADRVAVADLDVLAEGISDAVAELTATSARPDRVVKGPA